MALNIEKIAVAEMSEKLLPNGIWGEARKKI